MSFQGFGQAHTMAKSGARPGDVHVDIDVYRASYSTAGPYWYASSNEQAIALGRATALPHHTIAIERYQSSSPSRSVLARLAHDTARYLSQMAPGSAGGPPIHGAGARVWVRIFQDGRLLYQYTPKAAEVMSGHVVQRPAPTRSVHGFGLVPPMQDISHFRAPYKNAIFGGLGATGLGVNPLSCVAPKWQYSEASDSCICGPGYAPTPDGQDCIPLVGPPVMYPEPSAGAEAPPEPAAAACTGTTIAGKCVPTWALWAGGGLAALLVLDVVL